MTQAVLGFASEARWLRRARAHLRRLFPHLSPYLPKEPGCNKRLRKAAELLRRVTGLQGRVRNRVPGCYENLAKATFTRTLTGGAGVVGRGRGNRRGRPSPQPVER
jgi:hypothetical protein